jgi:WD40 repeat protein
MQTASCSGQESSIALQDPTEPVTSLAWLSGSQVGRYILASAQGSRVQLQHATTSSKLSSFDMAQHERPVTEGREDAVLVVAASPSEAQVAAGGTEGSVMLLRCTGNALAPLLTLTVPAVQSGGAAARAHSTRVFALKWHPEDPNLLFSGGWDGTVKVRLLGCAVKVLHGCMAAWSRCGCHGCKLGLSNMLLTGPGGRLGRAAALAMLHCCTP